jgi:hypothetical protein
MLDWLRVRAGDTARYIDLHHIIDVTFTMDGQKPEVISSGGEAAQGLYHHVMGEGS